MRSVPFLTSTVATAPRPFSMLDSMTTPEAGPASGADNLQHFGLQQDRFEQLIDALAGTRRDIDENVLAAPGLGNDLVLGQLVADAFGIRVCLVDLVDGHDDRHACGARMLDRLDGLRHDAVIGRHDQDHHIGGLGAAGAHRGECRMARRIQEGDHALGSLHPIGADVLGDATGLAGRHLGVRM